MQFFQLPVESKRKKLMYVVLCSSYSQYTKRKLRMLKALSVFSGQWASDCAFPETSIPPTITEALGRPEVMAYQPFPSPSLGTLEMRVVESL